MKVRKTFVLIIGGGPTGITTGIYFQKHKIPHILIEKDKHIEKVPRAHYYNNQTMEAWRSIFHLDKCFLNETEDVNLWKSFQYCLSIMKDKTICKYDNFMNKYMYKNTYYEDISPSKVIHLSQYKVLGILYSYYLNKIKHDHIKKREFLKNIRLKLSTHRILKYIHRNSELHQVQNGAEGIDQVAEIEVDREAGAEADGEADGEELFKKYFAYDQSEFLIGYEFVDFWNSRELTNSCFFKDENGKMDIWKSEGEKYSPQEKSTYGGISYDSVDYCGQENITNMTNAVGDEFTDYARSAMGERYRDDPINAVITQIRNVHSKEEEIILSNYVFVCEGGKSCIKKNLQINDENKKDYMKFINIHFQSTRLSNLIRYNPSMLYFIFNEYLGVLVCHSYKYGDFVLHIPYITNKEVEIYSDKCKCVEIINKLIDFPLPDMSIHNVYKWTMHSSIASTFIDKKTKRIVLLGDSAHKLPPSGGFGLNLGVGDAINIMWKTIRIYNLKKKKFLENMQELKKMSNSAYNTSDYKSSLIIEIKKLNYFYNMLSISEKKKIENYIESYNIERKLVANFTIYHAVQNYEKGNNIPCLIGYNYNFFVKFITLFNLSCVQNSLLFYYLSANVKYILKFFNNLPYIFECNQKRAQKFIQNNRENILSLLYPGVDFCYSYINTMCHIGMEENQQSHILANQKHKHQSDYGGKNEIPHLANIKKEEEEDNIHVEGEKTKVEDIQNIMRETKKRETYNYKLDKHHKSSREGVDLLNYWSENRQNEEKIENKNGNYEGNNNVDHINEKYYMHPKYNIFEKQNEKIARLKICKNIYEYQMSNINGAKIPHFNLYTFDEKDIYKISTIDLPILNNPSLSILIILFNNTILNDIVAFMIEQNIPRDKFSFCIWDTDVIIYKNKENQSIDILNQSDATLIHQSNNIDNSIRINDYVLFKKSKHYFIGNAANIKRIHMDVKNYNITYVFTSKIIQDMFLDILSLKSDKSFVILRPDRHIIAHGQNNWKDNIRDINKVYI
ncbi:FAD-dependent monooxygenase [Plasmodium gonderi]|uniref:FAD-dependent monooxygenase n=1 Tax=Plasmodium gonderi TaxID=77519 RepID=A0A1Y1JLL6_PLAGO|nr:FAD-dependent monooxygenase [Plasmodium gonderi]GAW83446.1 FAD-dependent monooxygenase [Plasmodium gonderi]